MTTRGSSRPALPTALVLLLALLGTALPAGAKVYFVDAELGSDSYSGLAQTVTGASGPWRSLARLASADLLPGDAVRLRCGQLWAETLRLNRSGANGLPITIGAYPEPCASKPRIDGTIAIPADNWVLDGGAVWRVQLPINLVVNGALSSSTNSWSQVTSGARGKLAFNKACPGVSGGCLSFTSAASAKGLVASPRFILRPSIRHRVSYSIFVPKGERVVLRLRRANPTSPTQLASAVTITGNGKWQTRSFEFLPRNGASDARLDFETPARGVTVMLRAVAVRPLVGAPNNLVMSGRALQRAHHPNFGFDPQAPDSVYLKNAALSDVVVGGEGSTYVTAGSDLVLPAGAAITPGLEIRTRSENWNVDERTVTAVNGQRIEFSPASHYRLQAGWGYFLIGAAWMLDSPDEWFYDDATGTLKVWMPDSGSPATRLRYTALGAGIDVNGLHDIVVENVAVRGATSGVSAIATARVSLRKLQIDDIQGDGVAFASAQNLLIENSSLARTRLDALAGCQAGALNCGAQNTASNNIITDSGVQVANGKVVSLPAAIDAAIALGSNATITGNRISRGGSYGMFIRGASTVTGNSIGDACLTLDDCAGIYASLLANGSTLSGNFVRGVWGNINGTPYDATRAVGIYLDEHAEDMVVENNTILDADNGIQVHNAFNNALRGNAFYGNRRNQLWFQESSNLLRADGDIHDNVVSGNVLVPTENTAAVRQETALSDTTDFATYTNNVYSVLFDATVVTEITPAVGSVAHTLPEWQSALANGTPRNSDVQGRAIALEGFTTFRVSDTANMVPNGNLANALSGWAGVNNPSLTLAACGGVNCVQIVASQLAGPPATLLASPNFPVNANQFYRVSFDASTSADGDAITVEPRKGGPSNFDRLGAQGADIFTFTGTTAMKRYSFIVKSVLAVPFDNGKAARIDFRVPNGHSLRVTNVEMVPVTTIDASVLKTAIIYNDDTTEARDLPCPDALSAPANCSKFVKLLDPPASAAPISFPYRLAPLAHEILYTRDPTKADSDKDGIADADDACAQTPAGLGVNRLGCAISQ